MNGYRDSRRIVRDRRRQTARTELLEHRTLLAGNLGFSTLPPITVGAGPDSIVIAQLDQTPGLDIAVALFDGSAVKVISNQGNLTFGTPSTLATGASPTSLIAADLDADTDLDLVSADRGANALSILLNNGDGTFADAVALPLGRMPLSVVAGSFDADSDIDLAVALEVPGAANELILLRNTGSATFLPAETIDVPGLDPVFLVAAAFDTASGDDIALINDASQSIQVLTNNGSGAFSSSATLTMGQRPVSLAVGRLDAGTTLDLVAAGAAADKVTAFLNTGAATFASGVDSPITATLVPDGRSLALANFDGSGQADLVLLDADADRLIGLVGQDNGQFGAQKTFPLGNSPFGIAVGDLNGDTFPDLAVSNFLDATVSPLVVDTTPVAVADAHQTPRDTTLSVPAPGVLGNDTVVGGAQLTAVLVNDVASGSLDLNPDGSFTYIPAAGFTGSVTFTYRAESATAQSEPATVTIQVTASNTAPVITPDNLTLSTTTVTEGGSIQVSGVFIDPDSGQAHVVTIDWGDGSTPTTINLSAGVLAFDPVSHVYIDDNPSGTATDPATITVTIADTAQGSDDATRSITLVNAAPVPAAGNDQTVTPGTAVTLNGSFTDPGAADTQTLVWSVVASNGQTIPNGTGSTFSFTPNAAGTYTVTFRATDDDTGTATDTVVITAQTASTNTAPVITPDNLTLSATSVNEGSAVTLSGTFTDPDTGQAHTVVINWGDGTAPTTLNLAAGTLAFGAVSHTYADDNPTGTASDQATITVTVTDAAQASDDAARTITVNNVAPTPNAGADRAVNEGTAVTLSATATDPGTADTQTFAWSVSSTNGQVIASGSGPSFTFTPSDQGTYSVTLRATDDDTGTATDTVVVTVNDVAPTITLSAPSTAREGEPYTVSFTTVEPGADPVTSYTVDWGDGTTLSVPGTSTAATHTYDLPVETGEAALPELAYIDFLRSRREQNPERFDANHAWYGLVLQAEEDPTVGLPDRPFFDLARQRRVANPERFDRLHPLLGFMIAREEVGVPQARTFTVRISATTPEGSFSGANTSTVTVQPSAAAPIGSSSVATRATSTVRPPARLAVFSSSVPSVDLARFRLRTTRNRSPR